MSKMAALVMLSILFCSILQARGIQGRKAPDFRVEHWLDQEGQKLVKFPEISDYKGKMLYIYCWQFWCPGCRSQGFPTLKRLYREFGQNEHVKFLAIQTTFEGNHVNTLDKLPHIIAEHDLKFPVGHTQAQPGQKIPYFMKNYMTGGTPWGILVGPDGTVLINGYELEYNRVESLLNEFIQLKQNSSTESVKE